jgi:hypothetical protein
MVTFVRLDDSDPFETIVVIMRRYTPAAQRLAIDDLAGSRGRP